MKFDYKTYMEQFLNRDLYLKYYQRKEEVFTKLENASMNGWMKPDVSCVAHILEVRDEVVKHSSCLVVVGIGGSFLGSCAFYSMFTPYFKESNFPIIYAGTTLSSNYMSELLEYLEDVDFSVNVISKSGTTMETSITYLAIKKLMEKKYSKEEMKSRIIITTDARDGNLRKEVEEEGYPSFIIPDNIGGRYSLLTPAHLFPLSLNISQHICVFFIASINYIKISILKFFSNRTSYTTAYNSCINIINRSDFCSSSSKKCFISSINLIP